jgi:predicted nucleic acid-binding protein
MPVLVDTSVWVDYFRRGASVGAQALDALLADDRTVVTSLIRAEILSGARRETEYEYLERYLWALPILPDPPHLWNRVARARYRLARLGVQSSLVDLSIAVAACECRCPLLTLDRQFQAIARVIPIQFYSA